MYTEHPQPRSDAAALACYHHRKVLVTGATEFTGLHCTATLRACGAAVATARHRSTPPLTASLPQPAVGDLCDRLFVDTGWQPRTTLAQSLEALLAWWQNQLVE